MGLVTCPNGSSQVIATAARGLDWIVLATTLAATILLALSHADDGAVGKAEASVRYNLKDPSSAQFRNEWVMSNGTVCGEVNARNSFGGYIGFRPFFVKPGATPFLADGNDEYGIFAGMVAKICKTPAQEAAELAAQKAAEEARAAALEKEAHENGYASSVEYLAAKAKEREEKERAAALERERIAAAHAEEARRAGFGSYADLLRAREKADLQARHLHEGSDGFKHCDEGYRMESSGCVKIEHKASAGKVEPPDVQEYCPSCRGNQ